LTFSDKDKGPAIKMFPIQENWARQFENKAENSAYVAKTALGGSGWSAAPSK